jgi:chemotaxis protein MotB
MEETSRGITLTIAEQLLYQPGKAELTASGKTLVGRVANILRTNFPNREFVVEGHTDNQPIRKSGWRSNWELGSARALSVVHELINAHGFNPSKLSATTYGEFDPVSDNTTREGRAANRRSVILVLPENVQFQRQQLAGAR